jgi:glycosyltransferase involved in cell wall biosynthesis
MHVLIIPSEEFIPEYSPLSGIFQYDQAVALKLSSIINVGVLSVCYPIAIKTTLKTILRKCFFKKVFYKALEGKSLITILNILFEQILHPRKIYTENINGINVIRIRRRCWDDSNFNQQLNYYNKSIEFAELIYEQKFGVPAIIHAHNAWFAGIASLIISEQRKIPFVITEHSTFYARNLIPEEFHSAIKEVFEKSKKNIFVSSNLLDILVTKGLVSGNFIIIPNVIDPSFENVDFKYKSKAKDEFIFLNIAELTEKKGQTILLKAFASNFSGNKKVKLIIGGDGDLKRKLLQLVTEFGITDQVLFVGLLKRNEVLELMNSCDVFVLPSFFETFGVVLIEAMVCGKPVIATKSGGPESIVNDTNGVIIETGNVEQLATVMNDFYYGKISFDAAKIREDAINKYGSLTIANKLLGEYKSVLLN